jgi:hypothetical protein
MLERQEYTQIAWSSKVYKVQLEEFGYSSSTHYMSAISEKW